MYKKRDIKGRFLKLGVEIASKNFAFTNLNNPDTELKQIETFEKLFPDIKLLNLDKHSQILCAGDLNLFFNSQLEVDGGTPFLKANPSVNFIK